jgi:hypothetical protein
VVCVNTLSSVLGTWAKLAETLLQEPNAEVPLDPLRRMVTAAERDAIAASQRLGDLLEQSGRTLFPGVGDPLSTQLEVSTHRWLAGDREESYSDWLAWILERQDDPSRMLLLFGLDAPCGPNEPWTISREVVTAFGRLDLLIRNRRLGVFCVEVKTESVPGENQLEGYLEWLARAGPQLGLVLLAVDHPEGDLPSGGCRFCSWKHVALSLRSWARDWLRGGKLYDAVMTLAFCGAVERNLLSLGGGGLNAIRTADYLEEVLGDGYA